ncbi:MAG: hypothetical protein REJ23_00375 [Brevundimonas sp.]|nr:hypothetical protein [Brevundimonas sp.]
MKKYLGAVIAAVGFIVFAAICGALIGAHMPGYGPGILFLHADIIAKLVMMLIVLLHLPILILGLIAVIDGKGRLGLPLLIMAILPVLLGCLSAAYGFMNMQIALSRVGPVSFGVLAPSYAEMTLALAMGFFAATLAMIFRALGDRRR